VKETTENTEGTDYKGPLSGRSAERRIFEHAVAETVIKFLAVRKLILRHPLGADSL